MIWPTAMISAARWCAKSPARSWNTKQGRLVAKLRGARDRKRKKTGTKVGGRKSHAELWPEVVAEARRRLRRAKSKGLSYCEISTRLKVAGYLNDRGPNPSTRRVFAQWSKILYVGYSPGSGQVNRQWGQQWAESAKCQFLTWAAAATTWSDRCLVAVIQVGAVARSPSGLEDQQVVRWHMFGTYCRARAYW